MPSTKSATRPKSKLTLAFEAIGTQWSIDIEAHPADSQQLSKIITNRIVAFDKTYSRFREDSWVNHVRQPGTYKIPDDFTPLFSLYQKLYVATDGAVTPLIGMAMERAGYDSSYSLAP